MKFKTVLPSLLALIIGIIGGFCFTTYSKLPLTDTVTISEEVYYSHNHEEDENPIAVSDANISIHFLELGNKYTGDCTYIKTDTSDILIDCGSKSDSVKTVSEYLDNYVTDGKLEYVIITHAHQDHYAGFATPENVSSIFDLYECENIITFSKTNQKSTSKMYGNYLRELNAEINNGAKHYTAYQCVNETDGASKTYNVGTGVDMTILDSFYYDNASTTENNYSVCTLFSYTSGQTTKNMLFTGDLEKEGEEELVKLNSLPQVDLYKAGHHGSKTSSSDQLLSVIRPKKVCVCCCAGSPEYTKTKDNQFPTQQFINTVAKYTDEVYVTTLCIDYANNLFESFNGNIVYMCKALSSYISCLNNNTKLKDSEWFKANRVWPQN